MAFNFPDSPTPNQEFSPPGSGVTYIWKAPIWTSIVGGVATSVSEAPLDGKQYGRQSTSWSEVIANPTWTTLTGKPATFPPTLPIASSGVTGLDAAQSAQDALINTKLDSASYTAADVLTKIKTVDGTTSGLDADLLDGQDSAYFLSWNNFTGKPATFPPTLPIASSGVTGLDAKQTSQDADIAAREPGIAIGTTAQYWRGDKTFQTLTKASVGLGNVDNTSDLDSPVSTATQAALDLKQNLSSKGIANGYASLDASAKVPAAQLPAYVDDVVEYANLAAFPGTGATGVIYVTLDTNRTYRWSGSAYVEISPSPGSTDSVPEGSVNLYYTNGRASAAAPVQSVSGRTGAVTLTKTDVGLANVDNTSDANKPISSATQTALNAKEATITAGTTAQYWRGDKTWQTHDKASVGLANVDNTTDANKPVSSATQTALNLKSNLASPIFTGDPQAPTPLTADNDTSIATTAFVQSNMALKANATHTHAQADVTGLVAALAAKEPTITAGTTAQYWRGDKSWQTHDKASVGLANVDNTSDVNKPVSTATTTALGLKLDTSAYTAADVLTKIKTVDGATSGLDADVLDGQDGSYYLAWGNFTGKPSTFPPTLPITEGDVTNLVTDLGLKAPLASPVFTGNPTAPTPSIGDNDASLATTAFVANAITAVGGFPEAPMDGQQYARQSAGWMGTPPSGAVNWFAMSTAPAGWLKCNGAAISRSTYAALFTAISTTFGTGDGSTTFNLPDLRGEFVRSWDDARGIDTGRAIGTTQSEAINSHIHPINLNSGAQSADHSHLVSGTSYGNSVGHTHTFADSSSSTGNASANHTHGPSVGNAFIIYRGTGGNTNGVAAGALWSNTGATDASGAAHTHSVAVSGTTGSNSANHTHGMDIQSQGASVGHTHNTTGNTAAQTGAGTETRPRNVALLACIKY